MSSRLHTLLGLFQEAHYDRILLHAWLERYPSPTEWDAFSDQVTLRLTTKARALSLMALLLSLGSMRCLPRALFLAHAMLVPLERAVTWWLVFSARRKTAAIGVGTVIGITGSYGKTVMKEAIATILSQKFRVHRTPDNINTLLGVAGWIRALDLRAGDVLVVEMGAYRRGDIRALSRLVRPVVGILTGINEAHLQRFGSLEATKAAKCELLDAVAGVRGVGLWNRDAPLVADAVAERTPRWIAAGAVLIGYGAGGTSDLRIDVTGAGETSLRARIERLGEQPWTLDIELQLFGQHHALPISAAIAVAEHLAVSPGEIRRGLESLHQLPRRFAPSYGPDGRLIIDDSYNITIDGVRAALGALHGIMRRKVGVFAGIPEGGPKTDALNRELGRLIAPVFDQLVLRVTPATVAIERGLKEGEWQGRAPLRYTSRGELEPILGRVLAPGDCLYLSAYDWPAIYL